MLNIIKKYKIITILLLLLIIFIPLTIVGLIVKNMVPNLIKNQFIQDLSSYGANNYYAINFWSGKLWGPTNNNDHQKPFAPSKLDGPVLYMYYKKNNYGKINNIIMAPNYINKNIKMNINQKSDDFTIIGSEYLIYCSATIFHNNKNLNIQDAPVFLISDFVGKESNTNLGNNSFFDVHVINLATNIILNKNKLVSPNNPKELLKNL